MKFRARSASGAPVKGARKIKVATKDKNDCIHEYWEEFVDINSWEELKKLSEENKAALIIDFEKSVEFEGGITIYDDYLE